MRTKLLTLAVGVSALAASGLTVAALWTMAAGADTPAPWTAVGVLAALAVTALAVAVAGLAALQLRAVRAEEAMLRRNKAQLDKLSAAERARFEKLRAAIRRLGDNTRRTVEREVDGRAREVATAMQELATQLSGVSEALATALMEEVLHTQQHVAKAVAAIQGSGEDRSTDPGDTAADA